MKLVFFIKSPTVDITHYNIKDIPGSSGRLDVIARCVLAALLQKKMLETNVEIWVFLDNYGTFIFNSDCFNYSQFPKNELMFSDYFVSFLLNFDSDEKLSENPLKTTKHSKISLFEALKKFQIKNYNLFVLKEEGVDFFEIESTIKEKKKIGFLIGSQKDEYLSSKELISLEIPAISMGTHSYLASSIIRLLKLHLLSF